MKTNKTLADVQPGGRVRLATVLYDRAHDLLGDAYNAGTHGIGYSQQAMELHDAIIPAQPSQVAYHGDVDLKWLSGSIGEVAHRLSTYMPTGLAEWADRARDCRIAAQVLSELSAQHSPGGQGGALLEQVARFLDYSVGHDPWPNIRRVYGDAWWEPVRKMRDDLRALAARQPVGEPVFRERSTHKVYRGSCGNLPCHCWADTDHIVGDEVKRYATQPAQAVDLGAVREALQAAEGLATVCASVDGYSREEVAASGRAMKQQFADALAKIDSKAVGK